MRDIIRQVEQELKQNSVLQQDATIAATSWVTNSKAYQEETNEDLKAAYFKAVVVERAAMILKLI